MSSEGNKPEVDEAAKANWKLIENDGALFRGPARGVPMEVWSEREGGWAPYADAGKPKDVSWGTVISEEEAKELMGDASASSEKTE